MRLRVDPRTAPGQQYRFASVDLPGLDAAGAGCGEASRRVCGQGRRSGHRRPMSSPPALRLRQRSGGGLCRGHDRRPGYRRQSPHPSRDPDSAGRPGAGRPLRRDPGHRPAAVQRRHVWPSPVQAGRPLRAVEDRRPSPGTDRDDFGRDCRYSGRSGRRRPDRRPCRAPRARAEPHDRRRARLRHRAGRAGRGQLDRPQLLQSRGRADAARRSPAPASNCSASSSAAAISCSATRSSTFSPRPRTRSSTPMKPSTILLAGDIERQSNFIWQKKWTWTYGARVARDR